VTLACFGWIHNKNDLATTIQVLVKVLSLQNSLLKQTSEAGRSEVEFAADPEWEFRALATQFVL
jgi:hypothetical protein